MKCMAGEALGPVSEMASSASLSIIMCETTVSIWRTIVKLKGMESFAENEVTRSIFAFLKA